MAARRADDWTLWIVAIDGQATSFRVYRGSLTAAALEAELARERAAGRTVRLELEVDGAGTTTLTVAELVALGLVTRGTP
jgi:hypothetical protein